MMAEEKKSKVEEKRAAPAEDPEARAANEDLRKTRGAARASNKPVSPLESGEYDAGLYGDASRLFLVETNRRIEELQRALAAERETRRALEKKQYKLETLAEQTEAAMQEARQEREKRQEIERRLAVLDAEMQRARGLAEKLENEQARRLELERETGTLRIRAEKSEDLAAQLAEERNARLALEKEKARLDVEVQHAKKIEVLLNEERQARANAQMRASTAESKLAQLQGEQASKEKKGKGPFWNRGR